MRPVADVQLVSVGYRSLVRLAYLIRRSGIDRHQQCPRPLTANDLPRLTGTSQETDRTEGGKIGAGIICPISFQPVGRRNLKEPYIAPFSPSSLLGSLVM